MNVIAEASTRLRTTAYNVFIQAFVKSNATNPEACANRAWLHYLQSMEMEAHPIVVDFALSIADRKAYAQHLEPYPCPEVMPHYAI